MESLGQSHHFLAAEQEIAKITHIYNWMLFGAGVAHNGLPMLIMLVKHAHGTLGPIEQWPQPFSCVYVFDQLRTPGYQFAYLLGIMYNVSVGHYYAANDMLYLGLCRYSVAYLDCLVDCFEAMDKEYDTPVVGGIVGRKFARQCGKADRKLERNFMHAIRKHYRILEWVTHNDCNCLIYIL